MSIRRKLLVALLSALLLVGLAASAATWLAVQKEADELFDYQLQQMALSLRDQTLQGSAGLFSEVDYDFIVQIWDAAGGLAYLSNRNVVLPQSGDGFRDVAIDAERWRMFTLVRRDKVIQVAVPLSLRSTRASSMALRILVPLMGSVPLFGLLIWWLVGRELGPLREIASAIRKRAPATLEPLPATRLPEEVQPMVDELNGLLGRLREAIGRHERFTADAAHELRSPLTALRLQIELAERADSMEERREAIQAMRAGARRAERLVEQMLVMTRLEPGVAQQAHAPLNVDRVAAQVVAELEPVAEAKAVELRLGRLEGARILGNEEALAILVRNLVDNALRYTPRGGQVVVEAWPSSSGAVLEVRDTGPGIPFSERSQVFERFYRLEGSGAEGSGLGLAIVKRIADAHGARIQLDEGPAGKGLRVAVLFRAASAPDSCGQNKGAQF